MYLPADMCMFDSIVSTCVTDVQCSWCIYLLTRVCLTASSVPVWLMCSAADVSTCWHVYVWQHRQYLVQKGCMLCGVKGFDNYPDYVYHIDSDDHKQVLSCFWCCCWCRWLTPAPLVFMFNVPHVRYWHLITGIKDAVLRMASRRPVIVL